MAAALLATYPVLLVTDARFVDGLYFENFLEAGRFDIVEGLFASTSMHIWAWMMRPLSGVAGGGYFFRAAEFLSILTLSASILFTTGRMGGLALSERLGLAVLAGVYPVYSSAMMSSTVIYYLPTALFFAAWAIYFSNAMTDKSRPWTEALLLAVLFISFIHNSLLVFQYALLLTLFLVKSGGLDRIWNLRLAGQFALRHAHMILLPPIFFATRLLLLPPSGIYAHHNTLLFDPARNLKSMAVLGFNAIARNLAEAGTWALPVLIAIGLAVYVLRPRLQDAYWRKTMFLAVLGGILTLAALFPYGAVGKGGVPLKSFGMRYAAQMGLGLGLMLLAWVRSLPGVGEKGRTIVLVLLILLVGRVSFGDQLLWQGRWAKDMATIRVLSRLPLPPPGTVLLWDDGWKIGGEAYRSFELSWLMREAWGHESWIGMYKGDRTIAEFAQRREDRAELRDQYLLSEFVANGCSATLRLTSTIPETSHQYLGWQYLTKRFFEPREEMDAWLERLLTIEIGPQECGTVPI
ncbi:MAG: hypothetical protein EPN26_04785, partial [Rhodospirillales bacterium]